MYQYGIKGVSKRDSVSYRYNKNSHRRASGPLNFAQGLFFRIGMPAQYPLALRPDDQCTRGDFDQSRESASFSILIDALPGASVIPADIQTSFTERGGQKPTTVQ